VALDRFHPRGSDAIRRLAADPLVGAAEPRVAIPAQVGAGGRSFDVGLQLVDSGSAMWRPGISAGEFGHSGILLSEKAGHDLGVGPGDTLVLRHPRRTAATAFETVETPIRVSGLHPDPFRTAAYMDTSQAGVLGLAGLANRVHVVPAPGGSLDAVQRALFDDPNVVSVESVTANTQLMDERMDDFLGVLRVIEAFVLLLALLIAFNSSSISADERAREHATMFAFGVPVHAAARLAVIEGLLMGVTATALGVGAGLALTGWIVGVIVPETFPDIGVVVALSGGSVAAAVLLGTAAVALAPLFTARRMRRMDVPATLRVVE
jgi:putative ABC transport system permease protein